MLDINLIKQLHKRNLIAQISDEQELTRKLENEMITLYCGFDPTADSLHLGHLVLLLCLRRFQIAGHRPIVLIGGATSLIGDPSFREKERNYNTLETVQSWIKKITFQISFFLDFNCGENSAIIINNYDWFSKMNVLTFLRKIGKYFSISQMINKTAIKKRFDCNYNSLSFTEFSYNLLQGYDFVYLNKKYGTILQIGGSDQWGNITSGIDLTRRMNQNIVHGLTVPLITKNDGTKFGKTENDTIWLDSKKTNPYSFYQFWININDANIDNFLKIFTFIDLIKISNLQKRGCVFNKIPYAKYILAEKVTSIVHGNKEFIAAQRITSSLFSNQLINLKENDFVQLIKNGMPVFKIKNKINLQQVLVLTKLALSKRHAKSLIISNAISVNGRKELSEKYVFKNNDRLYGHYTLLRKGKKFFYLLFWQ